MKRVDDFRGADDPIGPTTQPVKLFEPVGATRLKGTDAFDAGDTGGEEETQGGDVMGII